MRLISGSLAIGLMACGSATNDGPTVDPALTGFSGGTVEASGGAAGSSTTGSHPAGGAGATTSGGGLNGGAGATGGSAMGGNAGAGAGGAPAVSSCAKPAAAKVSDHAPALTVGTWKDISPPNIAYGTDGTIALGFAVDPCNPSILYDCITSFSPGASTGVYKSTDAGSTWNRIAKVKPNFTGADHLDNPIRVRVDPKDPQHVYVADGVRGGATGFWVSTDGGATFEMPTSFVDLKTTANLYPFDVYDVVPDPTDFNHLLLTFHSAWGWTDSKWNANSGILESKDGGKTWIVHAPQDGWGAGNVVSFLFDPVQGIGDAHTWLFGSPGGLWRTTDSGATWAKVSQAGVQHGGGNIYYAKGGNIYAAGAGQNLKSTDNGATWKPIGPNRGYNAIFGDGTTVYTAPCFGPTPFVVSPETDGNTWTNFNGQQFNQGPYEMAVDSTNRILYSSSWGSGVWALKLK